MSGRPLCVCHAEPMYRDRRGDGRIGWRCATKKRAANRRYSTRLEGVAWSRRLLQMRRVNALRRGRARRHQRTED